jgi:hypothetical protein
MSKFFLNILVQISKALVYSKINFYSEKNSPRHFRPHLAFRPNHLFLLPADFPPLPHWATAFRPTQPTTRPSGRPSPPHGPPGRPSPPHAFFLLPHRRRARTTPPPAGLTSPPRSPQRSHRKRKIAASIFPSFPPINRHHSPPPLFNPGNQRLQPHH